MRKLTLSLADLRVYSFDTGDSGGVHGEQCRATAMHSTCHPGTGTGLCLPETGTETGGGLWTDADSTCTASCDALGTCLSCPGHATCADGLATCSFSCFYGNTCTFDCP
jgi:hypothetical protein